MTKNGLRGFAGGLIVATFILSYVYYFQADKTDGQEITKADLENYALENQLIILTENEFNQLKETKEKVKKEEAKETKTNESNNEKNNAKQKDESKPKEKKTIKVTIKPGMSTSEVATQLQKLKLISSKSEFTNYIKKKKLESSIKAGSYKLNNDMTVEEIASILTK